MPDPAPTAPAVPITVQTVLAAMIACGPLVAVIWAALAGLNDTRFVAALGLLAVLVLGGATLYIWIHNHQQKANTTVVVAQTHAAADVAPARASRQAIVMPS